MNKQNSKKIAICYFGLSKCITRYWLHNKFMEIDHLKYNYENYQEKIFDYFLEKGYEIDVYFTTNDNIDDIDKNKLINAYKPINYKFMGKDRDSTTDINRKKRWSAKMASQQSNWDSKWGAKMDSKHSKLINVLEMCLDSKIDYDLVLLTRFDLIFKDNFNESNIKLDKFNIVSVLESPQYICDNFYLFPFKYLREFLELLKDFRGCFKGYHAIGGVIEKRLNTKMNIIKNEKTKVVDLTFYKISYKQ